MGSVTGTACRPAAIVVTTIVNCASDHALLPGVFRLQSVSPNVDTEGGELLEIRGDDLRFSFDEASNFFARTISLPLPDETVHKLVERTEGWIAGL
jgi:hypothetical protein